MTNLFDNLKNPKILIGIIALVIVVIAFGMIVPELGEHGHTHE